MLTLGNSNREEPITLIGPPGLRTVVEGLLVISPQLPFDIRLLELPDNKPSQVELSDFSIKSIPVDHWMPCLAYAFEVKRQGRFSVEKAKGLGIPVSFWNSLQKGNTLEHEGKIIKPEMVLGQPRKGIKLCYCTDSRPVVELIDFIREADLFICEGMYGDNADLEKAVQKKHMLFSEAAGLAKRGNVKELWLTHFSPALDKPEEYIEAASSIFENTIIGQDVMVKSIKFDNNL